MNSNEETVQNYNYGTEEAAAEAKGTSAETAETRAGSVEYTVEAEQKGAFAVETREFICALLTYILAFIYVDTLFFYGEVLFPEYYYSYELSVVLITALTVGIVLYMNKGKKLPGESFVWLGCMIVCMAAMFKYYSAIWENEFFRYRESVFDLEAILFFAQIFCIWWVLSVSGKLIQGKSGAFMPLDALMGCIVIPFGNFLLRITTVIKGLINMFSKKSREGRSKSLWWSVFAAVICLLLLMIAGAQLSKADSAFGEIFQKIGAHISEWMRQLGRRGVLVVLILSIPVGMYLYGLIGGSRRFDRRRLENTEKNTLEALSRIRRVPAGVWTAIIAVFSAFYIGFFVLQGSYLFGAFAGRLPEGFIVSEYARQGFFELLKVIAVNFAVLWLVTRMSVENAGGTRLYKVICVVFLAESMLFAIIAFSKLALYISCFGFTPRRLQSIWFVTVLFVGCVLWMYNIITGKKTFRAFMYFGAVSLSLLCLYRK